MPHPDVPQVLHDYFDRTTIALALGSGVPDHPLLLVNHAFTALTGFTSAQAIGRNCRFLQKDADNSAERAAIAEFLSDDAIGNVRTTLVNYKADGTPFINLLYMSKLRQTHQAPLIFASQFDVSHSRTAWLRDYDAELGRALERLGPVLSDQGLIVSGTLTALADSAATIANAKLTLANLGSGA